MERKQNFIYMNFFFKTRILAITIILICFLSNLPLKTFAQQSTLRGRVSIFNSKYDNGHRKFVENAQVEDEFNKASPTITDNYGQFKLVYVGVSEKSTVYFQVRKTGLQVVNEESLIAVADQLDTVNISMATPENIAAYRMELYNIGKTQIEKNFQIKLRQKINELSVERSQHNQDKVKIAQLQNDILQLNEQQENSSKIIENFSKRYSKINLDDASELYKAAFIFYKNGNLDSAQSILEKANFPNKVKQLANEDKRNNEVLKEAMANTISISQQKKELGASLQLKTDIDVNKYEFDSAWKDYKLLLVLDSLNPMYISAYAYFLESLHKDDESILYFQKLLNLYRDRHDSLDKVAKINFASTETELAFIYLDKKNEIDNSKYFLNNALKIYESFNSEQEEDVEKGLEEVLSLIGYLNDLKEKYEAAEPYFQRALELSKELVKKYGNRYEYMLAHALHNLGRCYNDLKRYPESIKYYEEALVIRRHRAISLQDPELDNLAMTLMNLGLVYHAIDNYIMADSVYSEAFKIYTNLAKAIPGIFEEDVAFVQINRGLLYLQLGDLTKSESSFLQSLKILIPLAENNPEAYELKLSTAYNDIGLVYTQKGDLHKAESNLISALNIRVRWLKKYYPIHAGEVNQTLHYLLDLYVSILMRLKFDSFRTNWQDKFNDIEEVLTEQSKRDNSLKTKFIAYCGDRTLMMIFAKRFKEAEQIAVNALTLEPSDLWLKLNLANSYLFEGHFEEALALYKELKAKKRQNGESYSKAGLHILDVLEKKGITKINVGQVKAFLKAQE